jgi:subtilase family serine protease
MRFALITATALALGGSVFAVPAAALPDLDVRNNLVFDAAPRGPRGSMNHLGPEQAVFIEGIVKNKGNQIAFNVTVELHVGGKVIGRQTLGRLRGGDQAAFSIKWVPDTEGDFPVRVIADPANSLVEADETNNSQEETVKIAYRRAADQGAPDTAVTAPADDASPVRPDLAFDGEIQVFPMARAGFPSTVTVSVRNDGDAVAENVEVEFMSAGQRHAVRFIGVIPPDEKREVSVQWTPHRRGPHPIVVKIDPENRIRESEEGNNHSQKIVDVKHR